MRCPSCGLDNDPANEFCARCHTAIRAGATPGNLSPTPAEVADPLVRARPHRPAWAWPLAMVGVTAVVGATVVAVLVLSNGSADPPPAAAPTAPTAAPIAGPTSVHSPGPNTADPAGQAADQAAAVDGVLSASVASRRKLAAALQQVHNCRGLARATADLRAVGSERESQLAQVADLNLSALPDGERLRAVLREALTYSLQADHSYVRWAQAVVAGSCPGSGTSHRADGDRASDSAGQSKIQFLAAWNPVAIDNGLPTRTRDDI